MFKSIYTFVFHCFVFITLAQAQSVEWIIPFGAAQDDASSNITVDDDGNTYSAGFFGGTLDLTPDTPGDELIAQTPLDMYLAKIDTDGELIWLIRIDRYVPQGPTNVAITHDSNNNILLEYFTLIDGDTQVRTKKFSSDGLELWTRDVTWLGYVGIQQPSAIQEELLVIDTKCDDDFYDDALLFLDGDGNCINLLETVDDSPGFVSWGPYETIGDTLYLLGTVYGTINLEWSANSIQIGAGEFSEDYTISTVLAKMSHRGDLYSIQTINDGSSDQVNGFTNQIFPFRVTIDSDYNIYVISASIGLVDYGTGGNAISVNTGLNQEGVLAKYSSNGDLIWVEQWETPNNAFTYDMQIDQEDNLIFAFAIFGAFDVDPKAGEVLVDPRTFGETNLLIASYNSDCDYQWHIDFGMTSGKVEVDADNNLLIDGFYEVDTEIEIEGEEVEIINRGFFDGYIMKVNTSEITHTDELLTERPESNIRLFPNPASTHLEIESLSEISCIEVIDILGRSVAIYKNLHGRSRNILVAHLQLGIYLVRVTTSDGISTKKVEILR